MLMSVSNYNFYNKQWKNHLNKVNEISVKEKINEFSIKLILTI